MLTESQAGPLYRVVGSRLSIFCNVSGVPSHSTASQNFDFRFLPSGSSPSSSPLNIISTQSKSFGYAMFKKRVANGEIKLTHTSPTSVVFEIQALQKSDEGEFQCLLVNPVSRYYGVYSASTAVKGNHSTLLLYLHGYVVFCSWGKRCSSSTSLCLMPSHSYRRLSKRFILTLRRAELQ